MKDSEIPRSQPVCGFLRLIAAYHVLLRLPSPRHPPCALSSLTIRFTPPETRRESLRADSTGADLWSPFVPVSTLPGCQRSKFRPVPETKDSSKVLDFRYSLGGGKRIRTADPLLAKQVLFQLSYTPPGPYSDARAQRSVMVGLGRVELPTSPLSGVRSSQLSYRPTRSFLGLRQLRPLQA